ncbi:MAG: hypothetical protein DWH91_17710 [Planctomycetota bacterium]|nr:MAG: hypothetical protein DWH91_17710 [Planctomycetota bacterium]
MWALKSLVVVVTWVALLAIPVEAEAADLSAAKSALQLWQNQIVSIRVQSQETAEAKTHAAFDGTDIQTSLGELDWVWEDTGRFVDSTVSYNDGIRNGKSLRVANSKQLYICDYPFRDAVCSIASQVTIHENSLRFSEAGLFGPPLWVLWDNRERTWLGTRLEKVTESSTTGEGLIKIDGVQVSVSAENCFVFLDPAHGYLPIRVESKLTNAQMSRFTVDEFREVQPGFWFPWKGSLNIGGFALSQWEVKSVDLNTELPDSLFVPPMGPETYVINTITGKEYWHAGKPPAHLLAAKAAAANPGSPAPNINPLTGSPEQSANWSLWLVLLGLILVSGGIWVRRRA